VNLSSPSLIHLIADPFLNGQYAAAFMRGLQEGDDPNYLKVVATCKVGICLAVTLTLNGSILTPTGLVKRARGSDKDRRSLEDWSGVDRHHFDADVNDQDFVETYLPAFKVWKCLPVANFVNRPV
jgi:hypothetical protein